MDIVSMAIACQNKIDEQEREIESLKAEIERLNYIIAQQNKPKRKTRKVKPKSKEKIACTEAFKGTLADIKGYNLDSIRDLDVLKMAITGSSYIYDYYEYGIYRFYYPVMLGGVSYIAGLGFCTSTKRKELVDEIEYRKTLIASQNISKVIGLLPFL